jgi:2-polyprenyl-3-methyl-5-hydroxy-6-metoxy-1,4-benzoquinol methylase
MTVYSEAFYEQIRQGIRSSAAVVVPHLLERIDPPESVVDVGCGEGWWGYEIHDLCDCDVLGIDGDYVRDPVIPFRAADLHEPLNLPPYDLVVCLEVAEHLNPERAESFVKDLCVAPTILFSAAIPGQGGNDHRNEQWQSYWAGLFEANGYYVHGGLRAAIWTDERVEPWYRQNLLVANTAGVVGGGPLDVVHPSYWPHG